MPKHPSVSSRHGAVCIGLALLASCLIAGCSDREERVPAPPALPAHLAEPAAEGVRFQAVALEDGKQALEFFGFDVRGAGLLPVLVSIANHGGGVVRLVPRQSFLVDAESQAWPLLTSAQALARLGRAGVQPTPAHAPTALELEALSGFALDLTAGQDFSEDGAAPPGRRASQHIAAKTPQNPAIPPGRVASGVLFFPGREEAQGARRLRLCYAQGDSLKFLVLPLRMTAP